MAQVINGVSCLELVRGFEESIQEGGPRASKSFLVPNWGDRYTVANGLLGLASNSGGTVGFQAPYAWPESLNMWCASVSIRGVGTPYDGAKQIGYTSAIVTANYQVPSYNVTTSQDPGGQNSFDPSEPLIYASQSLDFGAQVMSVPASALTLNDGSGTKLTQPFARTVGVVRMTLVLHRLPYLIPASSRSKVGQVNSLSIFGCDAGTLRFDGIRTNRDYLADGTITQETELSFAYRGEAPWDQILHPTNPSKGWTQVLYNGSSILKSFDFSTLLPSAYL